MLEIFKSLKGIVEKGDDYEVSNLGNVRNVTTGKVLKGTKNYKGYLRVSFKGKQYFVHKLVALAFIPNPDNREQVNHKKGKEKDNNRLDNLEWATRSENMIHAYDTGLEDIKRGEDTNNAKLTDRDVTKIKEMFVARIPQKDIAKRFNIDIATISAIKTGRTWTHVNVEGFTPFQKRYSKYSDEQKAEIRKLYSVGQTKMEISEKLSIPFSTVLMILREKHD
jgi:hypothetical protein